VELTPQQLGVFERLAARGFEPLSLPLYSNAVAVRKGECGALLQPESGGGMKLVGEVSYVMEGNLSVRVRRGGTVWFQWKKKQIEATPERERELAQFAAELNELLLARN